MLVGIFFSLLFTFTTVEDTFSLEKLKWQKNIVLFFPADASEEYLSVEKNLIEKLSQKDIVYFIFSDNVSTNSRIELSIDEIIKIKAQYLLGTKKDCWVLLGKNGKIKYRAEKELEWETILSLVNHKDEERIALTDGF